MKSLIGEIKIVKRSQLKKENLWRKLENFQRLHLKIWINHERENDYETWKGKIDCESWKFGKELCLTRRRSWCPQQYHEI